MSDKHYWTYTLNCFICGQPYDSKEAFPKQQICEKCIKWGEDLIGVTDKEREEMKNER